MATYGTFGDQRRRRQAAWRIIRLLVVAMLVTGVGSYAYEVGVSANEAKTTKLEADLLRFQDANLELRDQLTHLRQRTSQAEGALDELQRRYDAEVPTGELAELMVEVGEQLSAGADPERLAFLITAAAETDQCDAAPEVKRFVPRTPISSGPVSFVRFADRVTVTATGESARNAEDLPEAWYNPALPIRLEFETLDGAISVVEGVVPLTHRMAVDGTEYRFSVVAGEPRFVEVTAQGCPLPEIEETPQADATEEAGATEFAGSDGENGADGTLADPVPPLEGPRVN